MVRAEAAPDRAGFLTVAHACDALTRRQAAYVYSEHLRQRANGIERPCGKIAVELGMMSRLDCEAVGQLQRSNDRVSTALPDVVMSIDGQRNPLAAWFYGGLGKGPTHALFAIVMGVLWLTSVFTVDVDGKVSGIVFFVAWTVVEAIFTADEPATSKRPAPLRWPVIVRVAIVGCWFVALLYASWASVLLAKELSVESLTSADRAPLALRAVSAWIVVAVYSAVIAATSWWRRWRLRCSEKQETLLRRFNMEALDGVSDASADDSLPQPDLDQLCAVLAKALSHNHWNRLVARAIVCIRFAMHWWPYLGRKLRQMPSRVRFLEATTVALFVPVRNPAGVVVEFQVAAIGSSACHEGQPDEVRLALEDIKANHRPVAFDGDWFRGHLNDVHGKRMAPKEFRRLHERALHVSLAGSAFHRGATLVSPDVTKCRTFNERYFDAISPARQTSMVRNWLRFASAIACPVPTSVGTRDQLHGVLMVLRNVPGTVLTQEVAVTALASRCFAGLLRTTLLPAKVRP